MLMLLIVDCQGLLGHLVLGGHEREERERERERERPDAPQLAQSREKEREQRSGGGRPRGLRREEGKREGRGPVVVTGTAG